MKILAAAILLTLVAAAPAAAAGFDAPTSLTGWGSGAELPVAAPSASAWLQPGGVWLSRGGADPQRLASEGAGQVRLAAAGGDVTVAWVQEGTRVRRSDGSGGETVSGTMDRIRTLAATPSAIGWIGVSASNERKVQIATGTSARTPEQGGRPSFGLVAAGTAHRGLFAWHAEDGPVRRVQLLTVEDGTVGAGRWLTPAGANAVSPGTAMGPDGAAVVAWVGGIPQGRIAAVTIAPDGSAGEPQELSLAPGGRPEVAIGADGTAVVVWSAEGGGIEAAVRQPGEARFAVPVAFAAGATVTGWSAGVTPAGDAVVAWKDGETIDDPQGGGLLHAVVAPAGAPFGQPQTIADHVFAMAGAGGALTWTEGRPLGAYEVDKRVRYAALAGDRLGGGPPGDGGPGTPSDHVAPRLRLRVLRAQGRRVRVSVRSSERARLRASWRAGERTLRRTGGTLRAGRTRVLTVRPPAGARTLRLTVRATDAAGNARVAAKTVRVRRR